MTKQLHCIIHPQDPRQYYVLRDDGVLALYASGSRESLREYAAVPELLIYTGNEDILTLDEEGQEKCTRCESHSLPYEGDYRMEILWPWLSVFEQYGTNGCVYHLETGAARLFCRENYHAEVSGFSNGLLMYQGHVCLLHQTEWNRLDITDLETGKCLTDREIIHRLLEETDAYGGSMYEKKNYVDYFHGQIFFSPDYRYFVDTGWVWQPVGVPVLYDLEAFLTEYEHSRIMLNWGENAVYGEEWDQSAVWLDEHTFWLNYSPDSDLLEESVGVSQGLLQFDVREIRPAQSSYYTSELLAQRMLALPFVMMVVQSVQREGEDYCYSQMLNADLHWDQEEQLLVGFYGEELLVWDQVSGLSYCLRYGQGKCFYSSAHHLAYRLPPWPGNFPCAPIRALLKAARGFGLAFPDNPSE